MIGLTFDLLAVSNVVSQSSVVSHWATWSQILYTLDWLPGMATRRIGTVCGASQESVTLQVDYENKNYSEDNMQ